MMQRSFLLLCLGLLLAACDKTTGPDDTNTPGSNSVTLTQLADLPMVGGDVTGIAITPSNTIIAAIDGKLHSMSSSGGSMQLINGDAKHSAIALAPSGELYTLTETDFRTYDLATGTHRSVPIDPAGPFAMGRRIEESEIIISPSGEPYVRLINNTPQLYIYHSTDKGVSWKALPLPEGLKYGGGFAFTPNGDALVSSPLGLYRSSDQGATWTKYPPALANYGCDILATSNNDIYAYVRGGGGLLVSHNGGASFTELSTFNKAPYFTRMQQGADGALYALASRGAGAYDLMMRPTTFLRSTDGGATWKHLMFAQGRVFAMRGSAIAIGLGVPELGPATMHGGILISGNGGGTWASVGSRPVQQVIDVGLDNDGKLMILADNGLFRQTSSGWQALGTQPGVFFRFASTPQGALLLANQTEVFHSSDNGVTWSRSPIQNYQPGIDPAGVTVLLGRKSGEFLMSITSHSDERGHTNGHLYRIAADGVPVRINGVSQTFARIVEDRNGTLHGGTEVLNSFSQTYSVEAYQSNDGATWTQVSAKGGTGLAFNSANKSLVVSGMNTLTLKPAGSEQGTELKLDGFTSQGNYITRAMFGPDDRLYLLTLDKGVFISNGPVR